MRNPISFPALLLAALIALPAGSASAGVLDTPAQLSRERTLVRILASPEMLAARQRTETLYRHDPQAALPGGEERLRLAATAIAAAAANYALGGDPSRTEVIWTVNAPHRWHGLSVPGSGFGIDNPDNIYEGFSVEGGGRYVLAGRMPSQGPVQLHLEVRDTIPGMGDMQVEASRQLATLQSEQLQVQPDGRFRILIDSEPAADRPNHLAIPPEGVLDVGIRQLFTDWGRQQPVAFELERLDRKTEPAPREVPALAARAAAILDRIAPFWTAFYQRFIYTQPANTIPVPRARPGGRGLSVMAHFDLADDEALVITADDLGAGSFGIQAADRWGLAYEYRQRTSSLNNAQAQRDAAGTFTFVVSARDPGVHNWIDAGGFDVGTLVLRWQVLGDTPDATRAIRNVSVVKLPDLAAAIPAGQAQLNPMERKEQLRARATSYARRTGTAER